MYFSFLFLQLVDELIRICDVRRSVVFQLKYPSLFGSSSMCRDMSYCDKASELWLVCVIFALLICLDLFFLLEIYYFFISCFNLISSTLMLLAWILYIRILLILSPLRQGSLYYACMHRISMHVILPTDKYNNNAC